MSNKFEVGDVVVVDMEGKTRATWSLVLGKEIIPEAILKRQGDVFPVKKIREESPTLYECYEIVSCGHWIPRDLLKRFTIENWEKARRQDDTEDTTQVCF